MKYRTQHIIVPAIGLTMVAFGLHQIIRPDDWTDYLPDVLAEPLPVKKRTVLRIHGIGNLILGAIYISRYGFKLTRWLVPAWWLFMIPFCGRHDWRIGLRDMSVAAAAAAVAVER